MIYPTLHIVLSYIRFMGSLSFQHTHTHAHIYIYIYIYYEGLLVMQGLTNYQQWVLRGINNHFLLIRAEKKYWYKSIREWFQLRPKRIYIHIYIYIYIYIYIRGAFNKFPDFFVWAFKIVDSWKFSMLLLYI